MNSNRSRRGGGDPLRSAAATSLPNNYVSVENQYSTASGKFLKTETNISKRCRDIYAGLPPVTPIQAAKLNHSDGLVNQATINQAIARLLQIKDYLKQAKQLEVAVGASSEAGSRGMGQQTEKLKSLVQHLRDQERGYTSLLRHMLGEDQQQLDDTNSAEMSTSINVGALSVTTDSSSDTEPPVVPRVRPLIEDRLGLTPQRRTPAGASPRNPSAVPVDGPISEEQLELEGLRRQKELLEQMVQQQQQLHQLRDQHSGLLELQEDAQAELGELRDQQEVLLAEEQAVKTFNPGDKPPDAESNMSSGENDLYNKLRDLQQKKKRMDNLLMQLTEMGSNVPGVIPGQLLEPTGDDQEEEVIEQLTDINDKLSGLRNLVGLYERSTNAVRKADTELSINNRGPAPSGDPRRLSYTHNDTGSQSEITSRKNVCKKKRYPKTAAVPRLPDSALVRDTDNDDGITEDELRLLKEMLDNRASASNGITDLEALRQQFTDDLSTISPSPTNMYESPRTSQRPIASTSQVAGLSPTKMEPLAYSSMLGHQKSELNSLLTERQRLLEVHNDLRRLTDHMNAKASEPDDVAIQAEEEEEGESELEAEDTGIPGRASLLRKLMTSGELPKRLPDYSPYARDGVPPKQGNIVTLDALVDANTDTDATSESNQIEELRRKYLCLESQLSEMQSSPRHGPPPPSPTEASTRTPRATVLRPLVAQQQPPVLQQQPPVLQQQQQYSVPQPQQYSVPQQQQYSVPHPLQYSVPQHEQQFASPNASNAVGPQRFSMVPNDSAVTLAPANPVAVNPAAFSMGLNPVAGSSESSFDRFNVMLNQQLVMQMSFVTSQMQMMQGEMSRMSQQMAYSPYAIQRGNGAHIMPMSNTSSLANSLDMRHQVPNQSMIRPELPASQDSPARQTGAPLTAHSTPLTSHGTNLTSYGTPMTSYESPRQQPTNEQPGRPGAASLGLDQPRLHNEYSSIASTEPGPITEGVATDRFDDLRETIYAEVASLISNNETRPQFLVRVFRVLKRIRSDSLKERVLRALHSIANTCGAVSSAPPKGMSPYDLHPSIPKYPNDGNVLEWVEGSEQTPSEDPEGSALQEDDLSSTSTSGFHKDNLGDTVIRLDQALQRVREYEQMRADVDDLPDPHWMNDARAAIELSLRQHWNLPCSPLVIKALEEHVIESSENIKALPKVFLVELRHLLYKASTKYVGTLVKDCFRDLSTDVFDTIFNELAFYRLMQDLQPETGEEEPQQDPPTLSVSETRAVTSFGSGEDEADDDCRSNDAQADVETEASKVDREGSGFEGFGPR